MKIKIAVLTLVIVCSLARLDSAFAQGSLTPPGPPAPTMLTLTQVEPRTPVDPVHTGTGGSSEYLITQSGSYYLTSNVVAESGLHGINISASDVTLDLRGFSVLGSSSGWDGIYIHAGWSNVTVLNGNISGWNNNGTQYGNGVESYANNVTLEHLTVSGNARYGITLNGSGGTVRDCIVQGNATSFFAPGINATNNCIVIGCTAIGNTWDGIDVGNNCTVINCIAENNGTNGIYAVNNCRVINCNASFQGIGPQGVGINVQNNCTVKDCTANSNTVAGIIVSDNNCLISGNTANGNSQYGIYIYGAQNRVDSNYAGKNTLYGIGVQFINQDNNITRNFAPGNNTGGYYNFTGNNDYAPIGTPNTSTDPWQNFQ